MCTWQHRRKPGDACSRSSQVGRQHYWQNRCNTSTVNKMKFKKDKMQSSCIFFPVAQIQNGGLLVQQQHWQGAMSQK